MRPRQVRLMLDIPVLVGLILIVALRGSSSANDWETTRETLIDPLNAALHHHWPDQLQKRDLDVLTRLYSTPIGTGLLWGGLVRMFLVHHSFWSINSICHLYGRAPYKARDRSRNNPWVGVLAFGDGWHNNHHMFPSAAVHGFRWWQVDVNGYFILLLEMTGLAWDVKRPNKDLRDSRRIDNPSTNQGTGS